MAVMDPDHVTELAAHAGSGKPQSEDATKSARINRTLQISAAP
jgi:hypothetical protein